MTANVDRASVDALEASYRRLLSRYPRSWREHREEEVLAVLMEGAFEEGRTHPTGPEAWDLARHALATRLSQLVSESGRRRTAVLALWSGAALALTSLVLGELLPWVAPALAPDLITSPDESPRLPPSPGTGVGLYALWLSACLLVLIGRGRIAGGRIARGLILGCAVFAASSPLLASFTETLEPPLYFKAVLVLFALLAANTPIHQSSRSALGAAGATVALAVALGVLARPDKAVMFGEPGYAYYRSYELGVSAMGAGLLWAIAPAVLVVVLLATRRSLRAWTGPALVVGLAWALFALLAGVGNTAWAGLHEAVALFAGATVLGLVWLAGRQAGRRVLSRAGSPDAA